MRKGEISGITTRDPKHPSNQGKKIQTPPLNIAGDEGEKAYQTFYETATSRRAASEFAARLYAAKNLIFWQGECQILKVDLHA